MDLYGTGRLAAKDAESAILARIQEDFNLTPVLAKAHYEQMARYFSEHGQLPTKPGELCYLAVAAEEPAGKPIAACRKVRLELTAPEDLEAVRTKGLWAIRALLQGLRRAGAPRADRLDELNRLGEPHGIRFFDDWIPDLKAAYNLRVVGE